MGALHNLTVIWFSVIDHSFKSWVRALYDGYCERRTNAWNAVPGPE